MSKLRQLQRRLTLLEFLEKRFGLDFHDFNELCRLKLEIDVILMKEGII